MRNQLCAAFAAFTVLTAGAAAQLTPLVDYYQRFDRGITIGTNVTTLVPGTIRWNALLSQLQYYHTGGYWTSIGSGSGGGGGGLVVRNVGEDGTNSWTPTGIDFDRDTGLNVELAPGGAVKVSLGSHWYYLVDGAGVSNKPSGQQDLRIVSTAGVSQVLWDTNTSPWTLYFPQSTGPQGDPGVSFGVYRGAWSNGASYEAGDWTLHGGSGYGALTNFTADNSTPTNATGYGTDFIRLWYSGTDGSPGVPGVGLRVRGNWELGAVYDANDLVRDENKLWYTPVGSSGRPSDNTNQWTVLLRDGADGMEGVVFSNAVWAGRFNADALYPSNTIVYANSYPYGGYYVHTEYDGAAYVGDPGDTRLADTGYFTKLWHYARDGERGSPGAPGAHGADGAGNLWFDREGYQNLKTYTNGTVVIHNGGTYIYTKIEAGTAPAPGAPGWETYWQQAAAPGVSGGDWAFSLGYSNTGYTYDSGDVLVTDDTGIEGWFYLCKSDGTTTHPTNSAPGTWELLTKPGFRTFPILDPAPEYLSTTAYAVSNLVRYKDESDGNSWGTYVCIADTMGNAPLNTNYWAPIAVGKRGPQGPAGAVKTYYVHTNSVYYYETNIVENNVFTNNYFYSVEPLELVETNYWDLFFAPGGALTLYVDATPAGTTNILEMVAGTNDTNLVLRPDGAKGVKWGEETAESDPIYSAWATNGPGATNAILADGSLVSIDGWGSGGGGGNLTATNTPTSGQMLYASGTDNDTLYWGNAPEGGGTGTGWTNLAFSGTGNAITGATAAADTLTLQRGEIEGGTGGEAACMVITQMPYLAQALVTGTVVAVYDNANVGFTETLLFGNANSNSFVFEELNAGTVTGLTTLANSTTQGILSATTAGTKITNGCVLRIGGASYGIQALTGGTNVTFLPALNSNTSYAVDSVRGISHTSVALHQGAAGTTNGPFVALPSGNKAWYGISVAPDGTTIYATMQNGSIWKSTDSGATWVDLVAGNKAWIGISVAPDGTTIYATVNNGSIWKSVDAGATWVDLVAGDKYWREISVAPDGTTIYAAVYGGSYGSIWRSEWSAYAPVLGVGHTVATIPMATTTNWRYFNDLYFRDNSDFAGTFYSISWQTNCWSIWSTDSSSWRVVASNDSGAWKWNSNGTFVAQAGLTNNELGTLSYAVQTSVSNRMSRADIDGLNDGTYKSAGGFLAGYSPRTAVTFLNQTTNLPPRVYERRVLVDDLRYEQKMASTNDYNLYLPTTNSPITVVTKKVARTCDVVIKYLKDQP